MPNQVAHGHRFLNNVGSGDWRLDDVELLAQVMQIRKDLLEALTDLFSVGAAFGAFLCGFLLFARGLLAQYIEETAIADIR
ncbi:MAG: hypothetical protein LWW81_02525 [Rhodocyclales bacterium]|nr:hypothetical protein [Rhodocyclales bacterium]